MPSSFSLSKTILTKTTFRKTLPGTGAMDTITPNQLNKLIVDTGRTEMSKAFKKTLLANSLCVALIGTTLSGFTNAALSSVLILALVVWGQRQATVRHEAGRQIQEAFTQRGLHAPEAPTQRWKAEALVDALREYDVVKNV